LDEKAKSGKIQLRAWEAILGMLQWSLTR
jgi:hypothetical protein